MGATLFVLAIPILWVTAVWALNRLAVRRARSGIITMVFVITAASLILALLAWWFGWWTLYAPGVPVDPKPWAMLLVIGLPASLVTTVVAYRGSEGRTG